MKIKNSSILMKSNRTYNKTEIRQNSAGLLWRGGAMQNPATLSISAEGRKLSGKQNNGNRQNVTMAQTARAKRRKMAEPDDATLQTLKRLLDLMKQWQEWSRKKSGSFSYTIASNTSSSVSMNFEAIDFSFMGASAGASGTSGAAGGGFVLQSQSSSFTSETENTSFSAMGIAKTEDGREIDFMIDVEMSRSFVEANQEFSQLSGAVLKDPLVINVGGGVAEVSDQKFLFDLDADGQKDEVSYLTGGSGFLALDKNNDGKINDGNELFGTKSGDGFADLSAYDEDGNGWIDENDSVFKDLRVWIKGENGEDKLLDLKSADVGAIYLGRTQTDFSLNNAQTNETNAVIRSTGVFLKESGGAGTIQHVDFAI